MAKTFILPITGSPKGVFYKSPPAPHFASFSNTAQQYTAECPVGLDGNPVTFVTPAGSFISYDSQEAADGEAFDFAKARAEEQLQCVPPQTYQYYLFTGELPPNPLLFWVRTGPNSRELLALLTPISPGELIDLNPFVDTEAVNSLPGTERVFFFTQETSDTSGTYELAGATDYQDASGIFSPESWAGIPPFGGFGGWSGAIDTCQTIYVANYLSSSATFTWGPAS